MTSTVTLVRGSAGTSSKEGSLAKVEGARSVVAAGATRAVSATATSPEVSARMRNVRQRDTALERAVRSYLHGHGVRFRICPSELPGRPDVVNRARGWVLFIHGCFWHGHENCPLARLPRTNEGFWSQKLRDNRARDARKEAQLKELGLRVLVVWQCWTRDPHRLARALAPILAPHAASRRSTARSRSR